MEKNMQNTLKQFLIKKNLGVSVPQSEKGFPLLSDEDIINQVQEAMNGHAFNKSVESKIDQIGNFTKPN